MGLPVFFSQAAVGLILNYIDTYFETPSLLLFPGSSELKLAYMGNVIFSRPKNSGGGGGEVIWDHLGSLGVIWGHLGLI